MHGVGACCMQADETTVKKEVKISVYVDFTR